MIDLSLSTIDKYLDLCDELNRYIVRGFRVERVVDSTEECIMFTYYDNDPRFSIVVCNMDKEEYGTATVDFTYDFRPKQYVKLSFDRIPVNGVVDKVRELYNVCQHLLFFHNDDILKFLNFDIEV